MKIFSFRSAMKGIVLNLVVAIAILPAATFAQTPIKIHGNKFSTADDVKLGREAAAEAEKKLHLIGDSELGSYLERVGQRLAVAIPPEFQHPEFQYSFKLVDAKDINAFALPGGPMYVNSGMILASKSEDEMAGVMAHEISHVALRHGTANVTKQQKYGMLSNILGMGGSILGGPLGTAAQMGAQGMGVYLLKFSREYETEADLLGARIMANAGYNPRELANMFRTLESQGGGGAPSFLSDHPSAKDRYAKINQEAQSLSINTAAAPDRRDFVVAQQRLTGNTSGQMLANNRMPANNQTLVNNQTVAGNQTGPNPVSPDPNAGNRNNAPSISTGRVELPSSRYQPFNHGVFTADIPENWHEIEGQKGGTWFAPNGGYGSANGQAVFTHAVNLGVVQTRAKDAQQATDEFIKGITGGNLKARGGYERLDVDGRQGRLITFDNVNEATGRPELVNILTTQLKNGDLFFMIAVCPTDEYKNYQNVFLTIVHSIRLTD
ncbi:MAG TPA: M48 family metallopeptidase [Pyrinomonadaceae bacterium]|nr:M48 family metallopeptidase [Pyrinomonadaceae bacterium]